jgi:hypothetical protein
MIRGFVVAVALMLFFVASGLAIVHTSYSYYNFACDARCDSATDNYLRGFTCAPCPVPRPIS